MTGGREPPYNLRHTYICLRLLEGAEIAKNCRTSVEMIGKYYAAHLKTQLATAINIMRARPKKKTDPRKDLAKDYCFRRNIPVAFNKLMLDRTIQLRFLPLSLGSDEVTRQVIGCRATSWRTNCVFCCR